MKNKIPGEWEKKRKIIFRVETMKQVVLARHGIDLIFRFSF